MPHAQVTTLAGADRIQLHAVPGKSTTPALVDDPADRRIPYGFAIGDPDADLSNTALDVAVNLDRVYADENGLAGSWLRPNTPETTLRLHGSGGNAFLTVYAGDLHLGTLLTDELLWFMRAAIARIYGNPPDCVTTSPKRHRNSHAAGTHVSYQRTARPRGRRA